MKICALGNSFIIAIKEAIEESTLKDRVTFVGGDGKKWSVLVDPGELKLGPDMLVFFAQGKGPNVLLSDYEAFLIVGLGFSLQRVARIYSTHRLLRHATSEHHLISDNAFHLALKGLLAQTAAADLARGLRQHTDKPIFLIPDPNPIEAIRDPAATTDQPNVVEQWQVFFDDTVAFELYSAFIRAAELVANDLSVKLLPQPEETLTPVFSKNIYRLEFKPRYNLKHRPTNKTDFFHLNALFGRQLVKQIEPQLARA